MLIWALDIATRTGFAAGLAGSKPTSGAVRLKKPSEDPEVAAFNMLAFLRDRLVLERPDLVVIESYLNPTAQKSADAVVLQIMAYGVAQATLRTHGIDVRTVAPATWRKHYLGRANFGERKETKAAAIRRGHQLRYLEPDCKDEDRADALGIWDWAAARFARAIPRDLQMFA